MRIAQILAGSGGRFYCENCARDDALARALRSRGHEVIVGSLYLPVDASAPVFYGAVNLYLRHRYPAFRAAPAWLGQLLDSGPLLRLAGGFSGATAAAGLEALTLSMLRGEQGEQAPELERLVRWLAELRPEVVHLSNCLLLGSARRIRRELKLPVVCSLQDEDTWLDSLSLSGREKAWELLRDRAEEVDLFAPVSAFYARFMADRLGLAAHRLEVIPIGIDTEAFAEAGRGLRFQPPALGFLAHISESMGARLLAEAFILLASGGAFPNLRLAFMGGGTSGDAPLLRSIRRALERRGLQSRLRMFRSFALQDRVRFLSTLSVLSVPALRGEAFGVFLLEAMAAGVPVVQPRLGGFPEVVESTGGGILYEPNTPQALADALASLLARPDRARALGEAGRRAVRERFTAANMAAGFERAFRRVLRQRKCP